MRVVVGEALPAGELHCVGADEAEIAFLNAMNAYEEKFGVLPDLFPIDHVIFDDEETEHKEQIYIAPPMVTNLIRYVSNTTA